MITRLFLVFSVLLPLVLNDVTSGEGLPLPAEQPARPNVLLVVLDDAAPLLSSYGGPANTPHMDALAASGIRYELAFANSTGCNPSRVSFATGLMPRCVNTMTQLQWRDVMNQCSPGLGTNVKTMFQVFADAGYATSAVGKIMHTPNQQAAEFQSSDFRSPGDIMAHVANAPINASAEFHAYSFLRDWGRLEDLRKHDGSTFTEADLVDHGVVTDSLTEMATLPEPFFLAVGLVSPHLPRYVPGRLYDKYLGVPLPDVLMNDADDMYHASRQRSSENTQNRVVIRDILSNRAAWQGFNAAYYGSLEYADEQVGRLLAAVPENTVVVVWSDHGYHLGQKLKVEKGAVWRESYHVPLIVAGPGVDPGVVPGPTNSTEIYGVLLGLAGLAPTDGVPRPVLDKGLVLFDGHAAMDDGQHAVVIYNATNGLTRSHEFYDMAADPLQWRNRLDHPLFNQWRLELLSKAVTQ